jgi:prolyl oligopeptidase
MTMFRLASLLATTLLFGSFATAQEVGTPIKLWPDKIPGRVTVKGEERDTSNEKSGKVAGKPVIRIGDVADPTLTIYRPAEGKRSDTAVMVCPGGGYNILANDLEGTEVCQWLNSIGVTAALLKYRVPKAEGDSRPIEPLQDAQRAMSILRNQSSQLGLKQIGVLGFSAGGHLSMRLSTNYAKRAYDPVDGKDKVDCRPDFALLIYPAYFIEKDGSWMSSELPLDAKTPPIFATMAMDDPVNADNVLKLGLELKKLKIPCEIHLYSTGGHGYGLRRTSTPCTTWPDRATDWMVAQGWIAETSTNATQTDSNKEAIVMTDDDPFIWLEDVTGEKALDWVRQRNAKTQGKYESDPNFVKLRDDLLAILDSDARIPMVSKRGDYYYNFWRDKKNERGLWRRTTLDEYRKAEPKWETIIDLDQLAKEENENWVWSGASILRPGYDRVLINLSRGGADATVTREYDLTKRTFVKDGFSRPEAKGGMDWIDRDSVFIYTNFGDGSQTKSGYPRVVKLWKRGTPMSEAKVVYEGQLEDMYISAGHDDSPGFERNFVNRTLAFYNDEMYLRKDSGELTKVDAPNTAKKSVHHDYLLLELREPWEYSGQKYMAGSLLITNFNDFVAGKAKFDVLFEPTDNVSLDNYQFTKDYLLLNVLEDVKDRIYVLSNNNGTWQRKPMNGVPPFGSITVMPIDADESNAYFMTSTDFLNPTTLFYGEVGGVPEQLKQLPAFFDAKGLNISQHFATSKDGTKVPYFMVAKENLALDGSNPTLLYGYGGFEISLTPNYGAGIGRAWLSQGGVYVMANIRGGGEYGPRWHQAALKKNRLRAYEDFAAIAEDLVKRGVTSKAKLGIQGGSNGGLLVGNMVALYPDLFSAAVCQVPLLDMKRYHKLLAGASWMAEYGDPDSPGEWEFIKSYSPYQNIKKTTKYPAVIFLTSTRDDRVHPGHARKMMALMEQQGHDVSYYENIEGGHGGSANNRQAAFMQAMAYSFLRERLFGKQ